MKYRIADITDPHIINAAVAKAQGLKSYPTSKDFFEQADPRGFAYHYNFTNWKHGGPLIERERIPNNGDLIAALKTYLTGKFGEFVEIESATEAWTTKMEKSPQPEGQGEILQLSKP